MKKLLIILIVAAVGWFIVRTYMPGLLKPSKTILEAGNGLKSDEDRAKEAAITANLAVLQSAIVQYKGTQGTNPASLQDLVDKKYIQSIPAGDWKYNAQTGELDR
jgi:competence protein ComGC